jgi:hypothetical protein
MTLVTFTDHLFPTGIGSFAHQDRKESDGLFAVTMWSIAGGGADGINDLGEPIEPLIGLGREEF